MLYSTAAKDPSNPTDSYSKSVTVTDNTSEIYVMPDGAVYWYGWSDCDFYGYAYKPSDDNFNTIAPVITKNTNSFIYTMSYTSTYSGGTVIFSKNFPISNYTTIKTYYNPRSANHTFPAIVIASIQNSYVVNSSQNKGVSGTYSIASNTIYSGVTNGYVALKQYRNGDITTPETGEVKAIWFE
jgi:hypothetical protein